MTAHKKVHGQNSAALTRVPVAVLMTRCRITGACLLLAMVAQSVNATQIDIPGPPGSGAFGTKVSVLPNGNIVVTDPLGPVSNVGAVYLYSPAGALISTLTGGSANDRVGSAGVTVLSNGNFLVGSPDWDNGAAADAGALTWVNGSTGLSGAVSSANSLVGTTTLDRVGSEGVTLLSNGNYVVRSNNWDNGAAVNAGAVTWANGSTGISGAVSAANSLVGTRNSDQVGSSGVTALGNGNYVVRSAFWDNGLTTDAGAATWGNGNTGLSGAVSVANSLVGTSNTDRVGGGGVTALGNGNYVVRSDLWDNAAATDAGAASWGNGSSGLSGAVSAANSLVGTSNGNRVGGGGVTALGNGNYVVGSPLWDSGAATDAGAATWGNGSTGLSGAVSPTNSLVGTAIGDLVGSAGITALTNGNYVVASANWDNGAATNAGAVTWGSGSSGRSGTVSAANSLVGTTNGNLVGNAGVTALSNGNFVVSSADWDNGVATNAGAVTWGNGGTGHSAPVSPANSLVGTSNDDRVGSAGVTALSNGNYVVGSPVWDNGATTDAGAATWGNGGTGLSGAVSTANSLVGTTNGDAVGGSGTTPLSNGNYVVRSEGWDNGAALDAGAVTWGNGSAGASGAVSPANSLVGTTSGDQVGSFVVTALGTGNYVVRTDFWDNGAATDVGAVTWGNGSTGRSGAISPANSLVGSSNGDEVGNAGVSALDNAHYAIRSQVWDNGASVNAGAVTLALGNSGSIGPILPTNSVRGTVDNAGSTIVFAYDPPRQRLAVGQPAANRVSLFTLPTEPVFASGFE